MLAASRRRPVRIGARRRQRRHQRLHRQSGRAGVAAGPAALAGRRRAPQPIADAGAQPAHPLVPRRQHQHDGRQARLRQRRLPRHQPPCRSAAGERQPIVVERPAGAGQRAPPSSSLARTPAPSARRRHPPRSRSPPRCARAPRRPPPPAPTPAAPRPWLPRSPPATQSATSTSRTSAPMAAIARASAARASSSATASTSRSCPRASATAPSP